MDKMKVFAEAIRHEANRGAKITELKIAAVAVSTSLIVVGVLCYAFYKIVTDLETDRNNPDGWSEKKE